MTKIINNLLLLLIVIFGFVLRISAILADPFLHPWDERFHALVARNMMDNFFVPILRVNPITDNFDKFMWCCNHIWVHKQPLFMWQMALSMKIFGISEWSMRLPSAIMGTILVIIIYRIVILLNVNKRVALFAALILACSNFHLQLIAGIHGMDHNDVAHGFYVLSSIWALFEYQKSKKWYWIILVGVFSGCAILNKWLTGLLVYLIWGVIILLKIFKLRIDKMEILLFVCSLIVCCIVFLPWQFYILHRFHDLAVHEYEFNNRHISEALEGHGGSYFYYFKHLKNLFGEYLYFFVPIGIILSLRDKSIDNNLNLGIISAISFVLFFFSIIVKSKVDTYIFFIVPLAIIYISFTLDYIIKSFWKPSNHFFITAILIIMGGYLSVNPKWIINYLSSKNKERNERIFNASIYKNLKYYLPKNIHVVMNMNSFEDIDVMFYNKGITAYHWTLPEEDFKSFEERKIPIAVFEPHGNYNLPRYVIDYPYLYIIKKKLKNF